MAIDLCGPILANTTYLDESINPVAEDVIFTLPDVAFIMSEYNATGKISLPNPLVEAMESSITKIGLDKGFLKLIAFESKTIEHRFVQNILKTDGSTKPVGCKAFLRGVPQNIPGGSVEVGSQFEGEIKFSITRYQLFVDGTEHTLVDQLNRKIVIDGVDYTKEIRNLL